MDIRFSHEIKLIAGYARDEAMRTGCYGIGADHILLGILRHQDNDACRTLESLGADLSALKEHIDSVIFRDRSIPYSDIERIEPTKMAGSLLSVAAYEALKAGQKEVKAVHMLLSLSRAGSSAGAGWLREKGVNYDKLLSAMRESGFLRPEVQIRVPRLEEIAGALGEQLTNIFGGASTSKDIYS